MSDLLPKGLQFLQIGWWFSHALAIFLIYTFAYRRGRRDEKQSRLNASEPPPRG